jgi:BirA family biotin operon repressor/biotin-[acetyl-CoA-carboxylase] ligase
LQIYYLDEVDSTQKYLIEAIKENKLTPPVAVHANKQTSGIGSRGNSWIGKEGNLFLSFAIYKDSLPKDLKLESASIYFAYLLKEVLAQKGSSVWIKWPNDFYIKDKKIGGMITTVIKDFLICGVGLNLKKAPKGFEKIDIDIENSEIVEEFVKKLQNFVSWKQVFRKYSVEFYKNKSFFTHTIDNNKIKLGDAILNDDGSITINGERIYSLR